MSYSFIKVLIIDDEEGICDILKTFFEFKQIQAEYALNLQQGLEKFKSDNFNLIFIDNFLPDGNGIDFLKKGYFKKNNPYIVLMTGHFKIEMVKETVKIGVNEFLFKPFKLNELERILFKASDIILNIYNFKDAVKAIQKSETDIILDNDISKVKSISKIISRNIVDADFFQNENQVGIALNEAILNAIFHGNLGLNSSLKEESFDKFKEEAEKRSKLHPYKDRKVYIKSYFDKEKFIVKIKDEGNGFDWKNYSFQISSEFSPHGRGLFLIFSVFDEVKWNEKGNEIILIKYKKN